MDNDGPNLINSMISFDDKTKEKLVKKRWDLALIGANNAQRPIPILKEIDCSKTALCIIDMQLCFLEENAAVEVPEGRKIIPNINLISNELRDKGGIVIFFKYIIDDNPGLTELFEGHSYLGHDRLSPVDVLKIGHPQFSLHPDLHVNENDQIFTKNRFSAVHGSNLVNYLHENNIENVIITGVTTDVCAGNTAECLMQKDFHVVMVWDGTAALDNLEHNIFLAKFFGLYGDVMPTAEVLSRLK
ncbi:MAG: cysteine hydrolase [bacterium]